MPFYYRSPAAFLCAPYGPEPLTVDGKTGAEWCWHAFSRLASSRLPMDAHTLLFNFELGDRRALDLLTEASKLLVAETHWREVVEAVRR